MRRNAVVLLFILLVAGFHPPSLGRDPKPDNPLDTAAAFALLGKLEESRSILETIPENRRTLLTREQRKASKEGENMARTAVQWHLVHALLEPPATDPFEFLTTLLIDSGNSFGDADALESLLWQKVFARLAAQQGYPSLAAHVLGRTRDSLTYRLRDERKESGEDAALLRIQLNEVNRELERLQEPPRTTAEPKSASQPAGDAGESLFRRLLEAPRMAPFREVPLAPDYVPIVLSDEEAEEKARQSSAGLTFPEGFDLVRAESRGEEVVAIGTSQDYDPVGELSRGGYWVVRSHDGGKAWGRPLYTGLRIQAPYVVCPLSQAPLIAPEQLQIEVKVQELDPSSITFPPIGLRAKREQSGLLLKMPFADLERDRDDDGLTDLAEERLVTDPENKDTDGDGIPDGADPMPQVSWALQLSDSARALGAALNYLSGGKSMAIIHEIGSKQRGVEDLLRLSKKATLTDERTLFIVADRGDFGPLLPTRRIVVLSPAEHALAEKKFGPIFATRIELFVLDRAQTHALLVWDASWVGGTLRLELVGDSWRITPVSEWIT